MKVAVIGSGPAAAGVLIGLKKHAPDAEVTIFDIGKVPDVNPVHTRAPKEWTDDEYQDLHAQIKSQFGFAFPPPKTFFGQGLRKHQAGENAKPFISEFYGGLSRHWSASVFPFVEKDFDGWPLGLQDLHPYYEEVADEIGISGRHDELNLYFGEDFVNRPPIDIPSPIARLNDHINSQTDQKGEYNIISGLNRLAVETESNAANSCVYCGECMYGCFRSSIYDATKTVERAKAIGMVERVVNEKVFTVDTAAASVSVRTAGNTYNGFDKLYLGAGCFGTSEILMRTQGVEDGVTVKDNNSYVFPIFYAGGGISNGDHSEYISITNTILGVVPNDENGYYAHVHISPFADYYWRYYFPVGYWRYLKVVASKFKARMILAKMYFPTQISKSYCLSLNEKDGFKVEKRSYGPSDEYARTVLKHLRRVVSGKGFILPPVKLIRMSTSSHYVGAFPYGDSKLSVTSNGEVMPNVYIADSSVFPESPAQTLTFTIMANAARTARESLDDK
jgi:choline dehydrogenase-like flavoprotein